jgi:hypothetical protein
VFPPPRRVTGFVQVGLDSVNFPIARDTFGILGNLIQRRFRLISALPANWELSANRPNQPSNFPEPDFCPA